MKRYMLFEGSYYYPSGGINDFLSDFDTIEECIVAIENKIKEDFDPDYDTLEEHIEYKKSSNWFHVYDIELRQQIGIINF